MVAPGCCWAGAGQGLAHLNPQKGVTDMQATYKAEIGTPEEGAKPAVLASIQLQGPDTDFSICFPGIRTEDDVAPLTAFLQAGAEPYVFEDRIEGCLNSIRKFRGALVVRSRTKLVMTREGSWADYVRFLEQVEGLRATLEK